MTIVKEKLSTGFRVEIGTREPKKWSSEEVATLKQQAKTIAQRRSKEQGLKNELMAIQFELEDYLKEYAESKKLLTLENAVASYLRVLKIPFKRFAIHLDTTDGNLKKYLNGERRFNTDLALKFGHFFHTRPELWLQLQLKNELLELKKEKQQVRRYEKYDYRKEVEERGKK